MNEPSPKNKLYDMPPEVSFALATDRPQLLSALKARIERKGHRPTKKDYLALIDLVGDMIKDRLAEREERLRERELLVTLLRKGALEPARDLVRKLEAQIERLIEEDGGE